MKKQKEKYSIIKMSNMPLRVVGKFFVYAYALVLIIPLAFAVFTSFKTSSERVVSPLGLPEAWKFDNYRTAWIQGELFNATKNSVILAVGTVALLLINVVLITYCLDRVRNTKLGNAIHMFILAQMVIPGTGGATTLMLRRELGLYNNLWGEIICGACSITFGVFTISGFLRTIPGEMREAAMIDGANDFQIVTRIIVPVIRPALVTVGIMSFTGSWNNTMGALIYLRDKELYTIPMSLLLNFTSQFSVAYEKMFAGVIMTCIPLVVIYCFCQKYFISAMAGSVKG